MMSVTRRARDLATRSITAAYASDEQLLTLPPEELVAQIRALEVKLAGYERNTTLANALLGATSERLSVAPQRAIGRPAIVDLKTRQIAWAVASEKGGTIECWLAANEFELRPVGRVRDSARTRIRTLVFALREIRAIDGLSNGRLEQIAVKLNNYAKAGRALLRTLPTASSE